MPQAHVTGLRTLPGWLRVARLIWLAVLSAPFIAAFVAVLHANRPFTAHQTHVILVVEGFLGAAVALSTVVMGVLLQRQRVWQGLTKAAVIGSGWLLLNYGMLYVLVAMHVDPNDASADNAAGAGIAILTVPTFVVIGALLALGAGLSWAWARMRPG